MSAGAAGVGLLSACAAPTGSAPATAGGATVPKAGGKAVYARVLFPKGWDPGTELDGSPSSISSHTWAEGLVRPKAVTVDELAKGAGYGAPEPQLAESWSTSPDGLTWTFNLRKGVTFTDGTPFNADAAVLAIDRLVTKGNPYYFEGKMLGGAGYRGVLKSIRAKDPYTVEMVINKPFVPFLDVVAGGDSKIMSPAAFAKYGQAVTRNPVGTGPYKLKEFLSDERAVFERNPDYWGPKPYLDQVVVRYVPDVAVELLQLEAGEADQTSELNLQDFARVRSNPNLGPIADVAGINAAYFYIGTPGKGPGPRKPFDDVRVRKAFMYGVNRQEITDTLYKDNATIANSPFAPITPFYDKDLAVYPYDPTRAKQMLSAAGYPDGLTIRLTAYNSVFNYNPAGGPALAQALQAQLAKIGVRTNIRVLEEGAWAAERLAGDFDLMLGGRGAVTEPWRASAVLFHGDYIGVTNHPKMDDPKLNQMIDAASVELDLTKRAALHKQIQAYIMDVLPWLFINYPTRMWAYRKAVRDITYDGNPHFDRAWRP